MQCLLDAGNDLTAKYEIGRTVMPYSSPQTIEKLRAERQNRAERGIVFRFLLVQKEVGYGAKPHFDPREAHFFFSFPLYHISFEKSEAIFQTNTAFSTNFWRTVMLYSAPFFHIVSVDLHNLFTQFFSSHKKQFYFYHKTIT